MKTDVLDALPPLPRDDDGPIFRQPWQAHAFAMALALHERGLFTWREWAAALAAQIDAQAEGDPDLGETYYRHWVAALEALVVVKQAGSDAELARLRMAWNHAADRTPHDQPIALQPGDFASQDR